MSKHLTDAECAAEYWRAEADVWTVDAGTATEDDRETKAFTMPWSYVAHEARRDTWHRFATHPHATLEET